MRPEPLKDKRQNEDVLTKKQFKDWQTLKKLLGMK